MHGPCVKKRIIKVLLQLTECVCFLSAAYRLYSSLKTSLQIQKMLSNQSSLNHYCFCAIVCFSDAAITE